MDSIPKNATGKVLRKGRVGETLFVKWRIIKIVAYCKKFVLDFSAPCIAKLVEEIKFINVLFIQNISWWIMQNVKE